MIPRVSFRILLIAAAALSSASASAAADELLSSSALQRLGCQRFWELQLPLKDGESLTRIERLDDNLYALTDSQSVFTVHTPTGIIRWATQVADEGQTIRGPSHTDQYVVFTVPGAIRIFDRRTGDLAVEPRTLRGVIIDVAHDIATVTVGRVHGVRNGDVLGVYHPGEEGRLAKKPVAQLKITAIEPHRAKGRLIGFDKRHPPQAGDRIRANVELPLQKVKLPFAASSAAVADDQRIYVGAANQRFYCLDILGGFQHWQLLTPNTVSATPCLAGDDLFIAGLDGRVLACTKAQRERNWIFQTEGPIFADPVVQGPRVYVASSDRSLYCLKRHGKDPAGHGQLIWRQRFDTPLAEAPVVSHERVHQPVPRDGLHVLDAETGKRLWHTAGTARFLIQFEGDAYLLVGDGPHRLLRADARTGRQKAEVDAPLIDFAVASPKDQSILLATKTGKLACIRSIKAPRLRPAHLAEVLRNERKIAIQKELDAKRKQQQHDAKKLAEAPPDKRPPSSLFEDDWLRSRKTGRPVGGSALAKVDEDDGDRGEDEDEERDADEEEADDDDEYDEDDDADEDEDEDSDDEDDEDGDDEDDADEDDEDGDEEDEGDDEDDDDDTDDEDEDDEEEEDEEDDDEDDDD